MSKNKEKKPKMGAANLRHISLATRAPDNAGPMTNDESLLRRPHTAPPSVCLNDFLRHFD